VKDVACVPGRRGRVLGGRRPRALPRGRAPVARARDDRGRRGVEL